MNDELKLGGGEARLSIAIHGPENPSATGSDAEWLSCRATAVVDGFGEAGCSFAMTRNDLKRLARVCEDALAIRSQVSDFNIDEENLSISLRPTSHGTLTCRFALRNGLGPRARFEAECETDQTVLTTFIRELVEVSRSLEGA